MPLQPCNNGHSGALDGRDKSNQLAVPCLGLLARHDCLASRGPAHMPLLGEKDGNEDGRLHPASWLRLLMGFMMTCTALHRRAAAAGGLPSKRSGRVDRV